jgi:two-component sensor histidine kinase
MANSLQLATDFLLFEQARVSDPAARNALNATVARLSAVAQLHRFVSAHDSISDVEFAAFLAQVSGFISGSTGLDCTVDADPLTLSGEVAQQLAIVLNELAMNAAKHAYRSGEPGPLRIEARVDGGRLRLTVSDSGCGLRGALGLPAKGLGMTIVAAIVRQLNASFDAADDHGATITIIVPLAASPRTSRSFAPAQRTG